MKDQDKHNLARELREAETTEKGLTALFASIQPPAGACERLMAKLQEVTFHESQLTLDDAGPYSFEQAAMLQSSETGSDLLAAGLEEEPIDEDEFVEDE